MHHGWLSPAGGKGGTGEGVKLVARNSTGPTMNFSLSRAALTGSSLMRSPRTECGATDGGYL